MPLIKCPSCHGWMPDETGMDCFLCENTGDIWVDDEEDDEPTADAMDEWEERQRELIARANEY